VKESLPSSFVDDYLEAIRIGKKYTPPVTVNDKRKEDESIFIAFDRDKSTFDLVKQIINHEGYINISKNPAERTIYDPQLNNEIYNFYQKTTQKEPPLNYSEFMSHMIEHMPLSPVFPAPPQLNMKFETIRMKDIGQEINNYIKSVNTKEKYNYSPAFKKFIENHEYAVNKAIPAYKQIIKEGINSDQIRPMKALKVNFTHESFFGNFEELHKQVKIQLMSLSKTNINENTSYFSYADKNRKMFFVLEQRRPDGMYQTFTFNENKNNNKSSSLYFLKQYNEHINKKQSLKNRLINIVTKNTGR